MAENAAEQIIIKVLDNQSYASNLQSLFGITNDIFSLHCYKYKKYKYLQ